MATFLLIHGAWHGGWCWGRVAPLLEPKGHKAVAADLPGHGADQTPTSLVTLKSYTDRICEIAGAQSEPVILVGHSMGGVAITQAAEDCPEKIRALVYMCAFLPRDGDSLTTWASQDSESEVNPSNLEIGPDGATVFKRESARKAFYMQCSDEDIQFAQARLVPQSPAPIRTPVTTTTERWGRIPRDYIECARDRAITLKLQRAMQQASPCRRTFSIDTDHSPFFSRPQELADILHTVGSGS
ncbi:MAG: alpha/beta fold hydrolase [Candidatus Acidiferrales bacterium]